MWLGLLGGRVWLPWTVPQAHERRRRPQRVPLPQVPSTSQLPLTSSLSPSSGHTHGLERFLCTPLSGLAPWPRSAWATGWGPCTQPHLPGPAGRAPSAVHGPARLGVLVGLWESHVAGGGEAEGSEDNLPPPPPPSPSCAGSEGLRGGGSAPGSGLLGAVAKAVLCSGPSTWPLHLPFCSHWPLLGPGLTVKP